MEALGYCHRYHGYIWNHLFISLNPLVCRANPTVSSGGRGGETKERVEGLFRQSVFLRIF